VFELLEEIWMKPIKGLKITNFADFLIFNTFAGGNPLKIFPPNVFHWKQTLQAPH